LVGDSGTGKTNLIGVATGQEFNSQNLTTTTCSYLRLMMKINNSEKKRLLSITGASYGVDVKMLGEAPSFGVVTVNSNAVRTIVLKNFGDIPAVFNWSLVDGKKRNYTKFFTISPQKSTIPPHEEIICQINLLQQINH